MKRTILSVETQLENENISLPLEMVNHMLSFTTRESFRNFSLTCRFFNASVDGRIYNTLPAPSLNFKKYLQDQFFPNQKNVFRMSCN